MSSVDSGTARSNCDQTPMVVPLIFPKRLKLPNVTAPLAGAGVKATVPE